MECPLHPETGQHALAFILAVTRSLQEVTLDEWTIRGKGIKMPFHFEQDMEALERKKNVRSLGLRLCWGLLLCSDLFFTPPGL